MSNQQNICQNCGNTYGCSCQKRTASNGVIVCAKCIQAYEDKLKNTSKSK